MCFFFFFCLLSFIFCFGTSCIDLARKLLDTNFTMKLRAHDFIPKIYQDMRAEDDAVGDLSRFHPALCFVWSVSNEYYEYSF